MSEAAEAKTTTPAETPETAPEKTFTQAEVDAMIGKRLAKAMKGMPGEEELTAFRAWKESQQTEQEKWDAVSRERDEAKSQLTQAQTELEQLRRERLLLAQGVSQEDVDYYAYKIGKLVSETVDFEKAAEQFLKERTPQDPAKPAGGVRVDFGAPLGGGKSTMTMSDYINQKLRGR